MRTLPKRKLGFMRLVKIVVVWVLGLALLSAVGFGCWGFINRKWDGKTRFTIISRTSPITIKSFDPVSKQGITLTLPDNLEIQSIAGRGNWQAGVIFQAGKSTWASDSIAHALGITYSGIESSFGWWDAWQWRKQTLGASWDMVNLADTGLLEKITTPDGVEQFQVNSRTDTALKDWFSDQAIAVESLGVIIINTTRVPGMGADAARTVESMGLKVRDLANDTTEIDDCVVRGVPALKNTVGSKKLRRVFGCTWEESADQDLVLLLGKEYVHYRNGE